MRIEDKGWQGAPCAPRRWQEEALPLALGAIGEGGAGLVQAIMGAGKSVFLAEVGAACEPEAGEVGIVSTPTQKLTQQLAGTLRARLGAGRVGEYYADAKRIVGGGYVVTCNPSLPQLLSEMGRHGLRPCVWIVDEAHQSQCATLVGAALQMEGVPRLGLTATPYRSDDAEALSLWTRLLYRYSAAHALRDGVVVPWRIARTPEQAEGMEVDDVVAAMIHAARAEMQGRGVGHGGVCDAADTADADAFADRLRREGLRAESVHYKKGARVDALIEQLRAGALDVLVHVKMLCEGVDMPWLPWLALRKQEGSRVRFAQHVGRALRACPGKDHALILDPWDLFGAFSLSYEALLAGGEGGLEVILAQLLAEAVRAEAGVADGPLDQLAKARKFKSACALGPLEKGLRQIVVALDGAEVIRRTKKILPGAWRRDPASPKQLLMIKAKAGDLRRVRGLPEEVAGLLRWIYANGELLTKGGAGDFLDILFNLPRAGRWPQEATLLLEGKELDLSAAKEVAA